MTVSNQKRSIRYQGNDSATEFDYDFFIEEATHVEVIIYNSTNETYTTLTGGQYTITGLNDPGFGAVTYPLAGDPLSTDEYIIINRVAPYVQVMDILPQGGFYPAVIEAALDRTTRQIQQIAEIQSRSLFIVEGEGFQKRLPLRSLLVDRVLAFDENGDPTLGPTATNVDNAQGYADAAQTAQAAAETAQAAAETAQGAAEAAQGAAETAQGAAETAQEAAETAQAAAETAQGNAETAQSAAETAQGGAETAQAAAETAQGAAETAQGAAETAQGDAETAATTATTQAGIATTKAGEANTSAINAAASETAAEAAQTAAEAAQAAAEATLTPGGTTGQALVKSSGTDYDTEWGSVATAAQGAKADTAVQPADLAAVQVPTGGTTGQVLAKASNTDNDVEWTTANAGDVLGPSSAADSELAAFDSTTGKLLKKSTVQLSEIARATPTPPTFAYRFKEGQPLPNAFSFTRDDATPAATRYKRDAYLETVSANTLRHQYSLSGDYRGVLLEAEAENLFTWSSDLRNAAWGRTRIDSVNTTVALDPFGGTNAYTIVPTTENGFHGLSEDVQYTSGEDVCLSAFGRESSYDTISLMLHASGMGETQRVIFDLAAGTATIDAGSPTEFGMEIFRDSSGLPWWRCWIGGTCSGTATEKATIYFGDGGVLSFAGDGTKRVVASYPQFEHGRTTPSAVIPTAASTVTREADALTADLDAIGFNAGEGTLFWKGSLDDISGHQPLLFAREDDTDGLSLSWYSGNVVLRWRGSSNVAVSAAFTPTVGEEFAVAAYYGPGGMGVSVNGDTPGTTGSTVATPPTPTALRVGWGSNYSGSGYADIRQNGPTREFAVWDRALPSEITVLAARGPAIGETLYAPEVLKKRYIDVGSSEWGTPSDDSKDAYAGVQAALTASNGREIVFTSPYGGTRTYRFTSRSNGGIIMPQRARIIAEPGVELNFEDWGDSGTPDEFLYFKGTVPTAINLSGNAASGDMDIDLVDASTIARGDYLVITSNADFTTEDGSLGKVGEWIHVTGVSSNNVTFTTPLRGSYTTATTARVYRMSPTAGQLTLEGLKMVGVGLFNTNTIGDRGIWIENAINSHVIDCEVNYADNLGITLVNVMGGSVRGNRVNLEPAGTNTQVRYGITLCNMCEDIDVTGNTAIGGREAIALSATGTLPGVTRNIKIAHNVARGATRTGIATHDTHENIQIDHNLIEHCEQGIDSRIIGATIRGNTIRNMGTISGTLNRAIYIGSGGGKLEISGNTIDTSAYGVVMRPDITHETTPDHIDISNNVMRGISQIAVTLENTTSSTATLGQVTVADNDIRCATSGAPIGVQLEGKWTAPIVMNNRFRGGNGGRSVYMHATANGTGTNGAINPTITGNVWDDFTEPFIEHDTGKRTIFGNYEFDATSLPSIASASALTLPTTGNVFAVTGTTTINTINHAAAYVGRVITLMFSGTLTVTTNANAGAANDIQCAGAANFSATANDQLMLVSNGTLWREVSRTAI